MNCGGETNILSTAISEVRTIHKKGIRKMMLPPISSR
jgi:hypothetical protein